ncbi:hypothetical protein [Pseudomonas citronellolis]|uniref:hypothetical protein n=1 Tax=Pseudomonas citronellolis TaxID=53408 RepID=UPI0023E430B4|nr:hypothetical protein [Pseudomonas citronellolis]MDF3931376.1 hypothetical protein [Pseudomonas citronellolis]
MIPEAINVARAPVAANEEIDKPRFQTTLDGVEQLCSKCDEYWPFDAEFFFKGSNGKLYTYCKACYYEMPSMQKRLAARGKRRPV